MKKEKIQYRMVQDVKRLRYVPYSMALRTSLIMLRAVQHGVMFIT